MSTYIQPTTDSRQPTQTQTDTARPTDGRPTFDPADTGESGGQPAGDADSWVARCQQQFDARATDRLRNCVDDENHAMPTPHDP